MHSVIDRVEVIDFSYPAHHVRTKKGVAGLAGAFNWEPGAISVFRSYGVRISTEDGLHGGFVPFQGSTAQAYAEVVKLAPRLIGRNAFAREEINQYLRLQSRSGDGSGIGPLDIALWDLAGRAIKQSISCMLGGWKKRLPTYISTYRFNQMDGYDAGTYYDFAEQAVSRGILGFKLHPPIDNDVKEEVELVLGMGKRFGSEIALMHDPATFYPTFQHGLEVGYACDEAGFRWLEDPYADNGRSIFAHKRLREKIKTPVLQGERIRTLEQKADLIIGGGTDAIRAEPELDYGITGLMKVAHLAEALGIDIEVANGSPAQRHCISAIRNTYFYEICNVGPATPSNATPPVYLCGYGDQIDSIGADGCVPVPQGPGLGVEYDWDYMRKNALMVHDITVDSVDIMPYPQ